MPFLLYTDPQVLSEDSGVSKVAIEGELTIYEAIEFKEKLDSVFKNPPPPVLEIDLFKIQKMDTSCLQILLSFEKKAERKNVDVRFVNHSQSVFKLFDLYELTGPSNDDDKLSQSFQLEAGKD
ncbi:STAS domain-containing protein [Leptospira santarosai]|uniref:STAS domain-containing protein n=1 Tax=Leptospira santarosai TaxID=28183 RepID=UPI0024AF128C|nr:STAS domain-containing protein [Leptospira santarosai]MDI7234844.1 STAS domain-containing protein [Leptospira santarosai]